MQFNTHLQRYNLDRIYYLIFIREITHSTSTLNLLSHTHIKLHRLNCKTAHFGNS